MSKQDIDLQLKTQPDGFGFLYGQVHRGDETFRIDVLPPVSAWRGQIKLDDRPPHATDWIVYVDGEEFARVRRREDLVGALNERLLTNSV